MSEIGRKADVITADRRQFANDLSAHLCRPWGTTTSSRNIPRFRRKGRSAGREFGSYLGHLGEEAGLPPARTLGTRLSSPAKVCDLGPLDLCRARQRSGLMRRVPRITDQFHRRRLALEARIVARTSFGEFESHQTGCDCFLQLFEAYALGEKASIKSARRGANSKFIVCVRLRRKVARAGKVLGHILVAD